MNKEYDQERPCYDFLGGGKDHPYTYCLLFLTDMILTFCNILVIANIIYTLSNSIIFSGKWWRGKPPVTPLIGVIESVHVKHCRAVQYPSSEGEGKSHTCKTSITAQLFAFLIIRAFSFGVVCLRYHNHHSYPATRCAVVYASNAFQRSRYTCQVYNVQNASFPSLLPKFLSLTPLVCQ